MPNNWRCIAKSGARLSERNAEGLSRGMGQRNKMRFEAKTEKEEEGGNEKTLIRLIGKYVEISKKRRGFTPTESISEG